MTGSSRRGSWPFVARTGELQRLRALRSAAPPRSAVIVGAAGTGKSRLALESAAEAEAAGWATVVLGGSGPLSSVPCGPFRAVVPAPPASSDGMAQVAGSIE